MDWIGGLCACQEQEEEKEKGQSGLKKKVQLSGRHFLKTDKKKCKKKATAIETKSDEKTMKENYETFCFFSKNKKKLRKVENISWMNRESEL